MSRERRNQRTLLFLLPVGLNAFIIMGNAKFQNSSEAPMRLSARNILKGTVVKVTRGAVNSEVTIRLDGGTEVVSIITNESVDSLGLKVNVPAYAVIKASCVMVAVD